jgi:glyoxylase I family protein
MTAVPCIHHVSLLISDTQRALDFYHGVLGLPLVPDRPEMGFPGAWLRIGEQQLHLLELPQQLATETASVHGGRDRHFALAVGDFESLRQALEANGIKYTLSRSGRSALFCRDPDGNAVEIVEHKTD